MILVAGTQSSDFPNGFHDEITGWDRYEIMYYTIVQSSVGSNVLGLVLLYWNANTHTEITAEDADEAEAAAQETKAPARRGRRTRK